MEENKENAYLTCGCARECYSNQRREELYRTTHNQEDWSKILIGTILIDCFNRDCLMHKDHKQAMKNLKNK